VVRGVLAFQLVDKREHQNHADQLAQAKSAMLVQIAYTDCSSIYVWSLYQIYIPLWLRPDLPNARGGQICLAAAKLNFGGTRSWRRDLVYVNSPGYHSHSQLQSQLAQMTMFRFILIP
jgi:hypothetical protein